MPLDEKPQAKSAQRSERPGMESMLYESPNPTGPARQPRPWSVVARLLGGPILAAALSISSGLPSHAAQPSLLVEDATATVEDYTAGEYGPLLAQQLIGAGGVIIFPSSGGSGVTEGRRGWVGVGLARDGATGRWSYPAFFTVISGTFGQESGIQVRDAIFVVKGAMRQVIASRVKLETEAGLGVATIAPGRGTETPASPLVDVVAIPRTEGRGDTGAVTFEGTVLEPNTDWNHAYYGSPFSSYDILAGERVSNPQADPLREALKGVTERLHGRVPLQD